MLPDVIVRALGQKKAPEGTGATRVTRKMRSSESGKI